MKFAHVKIFLSKSAFLHNREMVRADLLYSSTAISFILLLVSVPNIRLVYQASIYQKLIISLSLTKRPSETGVAVAAWCYKGRSQSEKRDYVGKIPKRRTFPPSLLNNTLSVH